MTVVRDQAIVSCDRLTEGLIQGPSGERWRRVMAEESAEDALRTLLPEIVDQTLFQLLDAIDNDRIPLLWRGEDGTQAPLRDVGQWEMAGWLMGGDWPTRYSAT